MLECKQKEIDLDMIETAIDGSIPVKRRGTVDRFVHSFSEIMMSIMKLKIRTAYVKVAVEVYSGILHVSLDILSSIGSFNKNRCLS